MQPDQIFWFAEVQLVPVQDISVPKKCYKIVIAVYSSLQLT